MDENAPYQYFEDVNWGLLRLWNGRRGLSVLDAGCGFATTSARIQQLGNEVTGIEESALACEVAAKRLSRVVQADLLHAERLSAAMGDEQFDVVMFADVLEHVPWPVGVLRNYLRWLKPGGSVIISLPNVGLWSVRFAHLFGRWQYEETGILDRTHLRFFTRKNARWLLRECGLSPITTTYNPGIVRPLVPHAKKVLSRNGAGGPQAPDALLNSRPYQTYLKTIYPVERALASLWPGMLAFQMIFEAKREP